MAEIPEHLLKRAQAAREKAEAEQSTDDQLSSATTETDTAVAVVEEEVVEVDEKAEETLTQIIEGLGETVLSSHIAPNRGLWIRVSSENWRQTAQYLHDELDCTFFDWLSVIDWMPSPYGRELDTEQDIEPEQEPTSLENL